MKIKCGIMTIKGAPLEGLNPLPEFRKEKASVFACEEGFPEEYKTDLGNSCKVLPYLMQDRYTRKRVNMQIKTVVLENDFLRATFWPEYGGRLYSLFDKVEGRELLMANTVFQPANLAIRNAWLSGGIEWNIGSIGHTYTTLDDVFAAVLTDRDGNDFLRIYEFERCTGVFWQVDFHLPDDSKCLVSHVRVVNPYREDTTTYWWSNIAVPDTGDTRVLSSCEDVILAYRGVLRKRHLPYTPEFEGVDLSYPSRVSFSFDYFFQPRDGENTAWEAAAYGDGLTFFEISTAPLMHRKLFCWGNHSGGNHWQEFLSEKGKGYYAEIQAGFARSQMHDKILHGGETLEWTQCFAGVRADAAKLHGLPLDEANKYFDKVIYDHIGADGLAEADAYARVCADIPATEDSLVHNGSGFGAVEVMRMQMTGDGKAPVTLVFPRSSIGAEQYPWVYLLEHGVLPELSPEEAPRSYATGRRWYPLIADSVEREGGKHWFSLMHLGVCAMEMHDAEHIATVAQHWAQRPEYLEKARLAWEESVGLCPSVWSLRNLAVWHTRAGNQDIAEEYYDRIRELGYLDYALACEHMKLLNSRKKYEKTWQIYNSLTDIYKITDRVMIIAATAALRLGELSFLDKFFKFDHYDIREGENSLTDVWFGYCALLKAHEMGIASPDEATLARLTEEATETCPPPEDIDFRMSTSKKNKYRVEE